MVIEVDFTATAWIVRLYDVLVVVAVIVQVLLTFETVIEHVPSGRVIVPPAYASDARAFNNASSIHPSTKESVSSPLYKANEDWASPIAKRLTVVAITNDTAERINVIVNAMYPSPLLRFFLAICSIILI